MIKSTVSSVSASALMTVSSLCKQTAMVESRALYSEKPSSFQNSLVKYQSSDAELAAIHDFFSVSKLYFTVHV